MRCKQCGWPNLQDAVTCTKCGAPLDSRSNNIQLPNSLSNQYPQQENQYGIQPPAPAPANSCPKCGYPLRPGMRQCPNCNATLDGGQAPAQPPMPQAPMQDYNDGRQATVLNTPGRQATVNVWTEGELDLDDEPSFKITPVQRSNEAEAPAEKTFEGDRTVLNRDNSDPGNRSITSREQAVVYKKDGQWFIEDLSEQKTTFVQAGRPTEIHDGDVILLGNRMFIFHE